ncbi:hypothetical protein ACFSTD_10640 [Novosphingobium colocasiae]
MASSFLSPLCNTRTDEWGGSLEKPRPLPDRKPARDPSGGGCRFPGVREDELRRFPQGRVRYGSVHGGDRNAQR